MKRTVETQAVKICKYFFWKKINVSFPVITININIQIIWNNKKIIKLGTITKISCVAVFIKPRSHIVPNSSLIKQSWL